MAPVDERKTLVLPHKGRNTPTAGESTVGLPTDVVGRSAERLRTIALLYAFVFAMAGYLPGLLVTRDLFSSVLFWAPGLIAISGALVVAAVVRSPHVPLPAVMTIGLVFEVVGSYGIATAELLNPRGLQIHHGWVGLSWVAPWTLLYTVVIPTPPRRAMIAALASVSSVPVVAAAVLAVYGGVFQPSQAEFFFGLVFPYALIVLMAYVGARVVYALGTEVGRARELGSYHLVERLGEGGMGEVWRAKHRMLARPAAIKLVRPSAARDIRNLASDEARRRFEREAQVIASLRSPHTIDLFDFGIADDGTFFYVMELLEGQDADMLVRRTGPMPPERAIYLLRQVCHSLSEAESRGLVHRDIKPANIFVCRYGEDYDFVKVLDFGIVKAATDRAETAAPLTMKNAVHGTPAFIAPEQAFGESTIDARADIYATGCVAYWLLTGELVFTADTPIGLVMHHVHTAPMRPSTRTELRIPPELDELVLSCLAKDPAQRPQTARELSSRLANVPCANAWTEERARRWWGSHQPATSSS